MNAVVRALPTAWIDLAHGPGRNALALSGLLLIVAAGLGVQGHERLPLLMLLAATVAGVGIGRRSAGADRVSGRSVLLFQRPLTPAAHYAARLLLGLALFAAAALLTAAIVTAAGELTRPWVHALGACYWALLMLVVSTALSAVAPRHDVELLVLLFAVSAAQVLVANAIGITGLREVLQWLLIPIDAVFGTWNRWAAGNYTVTPVYAGQLLLQPIAWATLLFLRLRRIDIGAADYHTSA